MAQRRMLSLKIIDTDLFLDMPVSAQNLYFHLSLRGDDDGFVANPKKIMRIVSCSNDDYKLLLAKEFIIVFNSGVCVIRHWKVHNYIQKDRYHRTMYIEEKRQIKEDKNSVYTKCIQNVSIPRPEVRLELELGKEKKGENSFSLNSKKPLFTPPPPDESIFDTPDFSDDITNIIKHWDSLGLIKVRNSLIPDFMNDGKILDCFKDYGFDKISLAIKNYSFIQESDEHNSTPFSSLQNFLKSSDAVNLYSQTEIVMKMKKNVNFNKSSEHGSNMDEINSRLEQTKISQKEWEDDREQL